MKRLFALALFAAVLLLAASAQTPSPQPSQPAQRPPAADAHMDFEEYEPKSTLVVPEHPVTRARYPFIDVHNHQNRAPEMSAEDVAKLVSEMDKLNMAVMVNLSGSSGETLQKGLANLKGRYP